MNHLAKGDMNELTQVKSLKLEREKETNERNFLLLLEREKKNKPQNKK